MTARQLPSQEYLRQCFDYDPATGSLRWRPRPQSHFERSYEFKRWNSRFAGTEAGFPKKRGNREVLVCHRCYQTQRVIWKLVTGEDPPHEVDHKNCNPSDNRRENLRLASRPQNIVNRPAQRNNKLGVKGVHQVRDRFRAHINVGGKLRHLGYFDTAEKASAEYEAWAKKIHGEFWNPD